MKKAQKHRLTRFELTHGKKQGGSRKEISLFAFLIYIIVYKNLKTVLFGITKVIFNKAVFFYALKEAKTKGVKYNGGKYEKIKTEQYA